MSSHSIYPILGYSLSNLNSESLDLSASRLNELGIDSSNNMQLASYIYNSRVRYGGYGEIRDLYDRSSLFQTLKDKRNIHLGLDIWFPEGTPIYSPWNGEIVSSHDNSAFGDYGPTLIVQHDLGPESMFVLYGHLSKSSISNWQEGDKVIQGELLAHFGTESENGGWPPHVHLQMIKDLEGNRHDYPGVCSSREWNRYRLNCPDPSPFIIQCR